ncbi:MAG: hypothetical protein ACK4QW_16640 [Alphaproteobacteria bacterium]
MRFPFPRTAAGGAVTFPPPGEAFALAALDVRIPLSDPIPLQAAGRSRRSINGP